MTGAMTRHFHLRTSDKPLGRLACSFFRFVTRGGTNAYHGHDFELDLTCLTYVRCCLHLFKEKKLESFKIASNIDQERMLLVRLISMATHVSFLGLVILRMMMEI
ncbi:hypothetical protein B566_EDAN017304 [Ephemera danica]|nr:hypothetical protein B566_EDAN017304 [Ephemera danica]